MYDDFAGICGITEEELVGNMTEDIDMLAEANDLSRETAIAKLKEHYGGYHFCANSPEMFNPFSLLNCFSEKRFGNYSFSSGMPTYLVNMMRKFKVCPTDIGRKKALASSFNAPTDNMFTITPLLYQTGYLTIKDYEDMTRIYTLDIPNEEVKSGINIE